MTHPIQATCLICGAPAKDHSPTDWDGLKLECADCGRYAVAESVLDRLAGETVGDRRATLAKARSWHPNEPFPMIDTYCFTRTG